MVPGVEAEIRDEAGNALDPGQSGLLWVRGRQVSGEYRGQQSMLDAQGWLLTRDIARQDADGYLFIEGRADDTIIRGGENISPAEIEDVLVMHPGVREVAVVGTPDDDWGARICAVVVPEPGTAPTAEELRAFVRQRLRSRTGARRRARASPRDGPEQESGDDAYVERRVVDTSRVPYRILDQRLQDELGHEGF